MIRGGCLALTLFALLVQVTAAQAAGRVALVIGNGAYQSVPLLTNPVNDAADVAASLKRLDFEVKVLSNAKYDEMRRALVGFSQQARGAEFAVVFFAGHGMEIGGENWLIPTDAQLVADADVAGEAIGLQFLMRSVTSASKLGLVILDACRNNPFLPKMQRTDMKRNVDRGFARVEPGDNVLVAYAARDGTTASDGRERNSPFTRALLKNLETPGLEIRFLFANVRDEVLAVTNRDQQPFTYGSLSKDPIYLKGGPTPGMPPSQPADSPAQAWAATEGTTNAALLEEFIRRYSDSYYASLARARLDELKKQQEPKKQQEAALVVPPIAPAKQSGDCAGDTVAVSMSSRSPCPLSQAEERALKPKDVFRECADCPEMVVIPSGLFSMGSPESEQGRDKNEPQHLVRHARPFSVGKFHVTVDQFKMFVAETGYDAGSRCSTVENGEGEIRDQRSWRNPGFAQAGSHPAVCLSWSDAKAYVAWMTKKTGKPYRLLSESEWEYAARAGSTTRYFFGENEKEMCRYGNGWDQRARRDVRGAKGAFLPCDDGYAYTSPVGSFLPNALGLYDMHGNALQWIEDCQNALSYDSGIGAPTDGTAWTSSVCEYRRLRGGSWDSYPRGLRSASRYITDIGSRINTNGLRLGRTLAP